MTIQDRNTGGIHPNCHHPKPRPTTPQDFVDSIDLQYRKETCQFIYKISAEIFLTMIKVKVRQDYDGMKNQELRSQNEWDLCQQSSEPSLPLSTIDGQCIFEKKSKKCSTLSYCFFRIFIKKSRNFAQSCFNPIRCGGLET